MNPGDARERLKAFIEHQAAGGTMSSEDTLRLLEDLRRHQVELEMQNEELKAAHEVIKEGRERLSDLYDFAPVAYLTIDTSGVIEQANLTAASLLGVGRQQLIGRTFFSFVARADRDRFFLHLSSVLNGRRREVDELQLKSATGQMVYGRVESLFVEDRSGKQSIRSVVSDVTQRRHAELALRESDRKYRDLVESVHSIIMRIDPEGRVTFLNDYGRQFFGYAKEELQGKSVVGTIVAEEEAARLDFRELLASIAKNPHRFRENEAEHRRGSGETVWVSWAVTPVHDGNGVFVGLLAVGNDVTERKKLQEELRQSQKMEAVGVLAGGIAHDFNNLLAVILGNAELALDEPKDEDGVQHNLQQILKASKRARDLIRQILTFSRKSEKKRKPVEVVPLVKETFQLLRSSIPANIEMSLELDGAGLAVVAEPSELQQIIMNLASNAEHAMRGDGGLLTLRLDRKTCAPDDRLPDADMEPGDYAVLTVGDTGIGMTAETRQRVFEPFFTTKEIGEGTGMGLAVVYGIVRSLGGGVSVNSTPGKGTAFQVFLPITSPDADRPETEGVKLLGGKERILFVDDEEAVTETNRTMLERLGYRVTATTDSDKALELFVHDPAGYDLVITDQAMPRITGIQLAEKMLEIRGDIPIILCTGYSPTATSETAGAKGVKGFLMKPIVRKELAGTIRRVLDRR